MNDEIKPCPFCEMDNPDIRNQGLFRSLLAWRITCRATYCLAEIRAKTKVEVVEAWNRRSPLPALKAVGHEVK